jgi:predicted NAD-dependent protein-ADP-ribosyltransferase YbiA (DUF1768 family)
VNSDKKNKPRVHKVFGVKKTKKQVHFASIADVVFFYKGDESGMFSNFKVEPVDFCHKEKPSRVKKRRR